MDGRTSFWLGWIALALSCAGCVTTQPQTQSQATPPATPPPSSTPMTAPIAVNEAPLPKITPKKGDGAKRDAHATTELAFGQIKEADAETEAAQNNPSAQARLRDEARQAYQKAVKLEPNNVDGYRCLARLYAKMGDYDRAFDHYNKAMAKNPKDAALWYELALCHNRRKDFAQSIPCFQKALEFAPDNRDYLKTLGFTLAYNGQFEQGLTLLIRAQALAMAHYNIAQVLVHREQVEPAKQQLRLALRENPRYEQARALLSKLEPPSTAALPTLGPVTP